MQRGQSSSCFTAKGFASVKRLSRWRKARWSCLSTFTRNFLKLRQTGIHLLLPQSCAIHAFVLFLKDTRQQKALSICFSRCDETKGTAVTYRLEHDIVSASSILCVCVWVTHTSRFTQPQGRLGNGHDCVSCCQREGDTLDLDMTGQKSTLHTLPHTFEATVSDLCPYLLAQCIFHGAFSHRMI